MKCAIVGYGYWGRILRRYIENSEEFELYSIFSTSTVQDELYVNDIRHIMDNENIKAIFVCTPINTHYDICREAIQKGKHVFCEKPLDKNVNKVEHLYALAISNNVVLFTDYIYTISSSIKKMKYIVSQFSSKANMSGKITQYGNFYKEDDVLDVLGVHLLSIISYFFEVDNPKVVIKKKEYDFNGNLGNLIFNIDDTKYTAEIEISLISQNKERTIIIECNENKLIFDMLSEFPLKTIESGKIKSYDFDEKNNIKESLRTFHNFIFNKNINSNWQIVLKVAKLMDIIKGEKNYNGL